MRAKKRKVIIDTNCWISFLIGQRLSSLASLLINDKVELVLCEELLDELKEVTMRPKFVKYFPQKEVESLITFLRNKSSMVELVISVRMCRDEEDDFLLSLAKQAKANYLVTGDKDLLVIGKIAKCKIIDAATFENEMKAFVD